MYRWYALEECLNDRLKWIKIESWKCDDNDNMWQYVDNLFCKVIWSVYCGWRIYGLILTVYERLGRIFLIYWILLGNFLND